MARRFFTAGPWWLLFHALFLGTLPDSQSRDNVMVAYLNVPRVSPSRIALSSKNNRCQLLMSVGGAGSKRGGRLPAITEESLAGVSYKGQSSERLLLLGRKDSWKEACDLELAAIGAIQVEEGLWKTEKPLPREQLLLLTGVKAEVIPVSGQDGIRSLCDLCDVLTTADIHAHG